MPKNKDPPPFPSPAMRLLISSAQSLEFQTLGHWGHPEVTFLPVRYKHNKIAHLLFLPAPLKEHQSHGYMYSDVTQNSIFKLRQNILLVIYRRKPLTSKRMEQQNSFMLPVASKTVNTTMAEYICFLSLRRYSFSVHLCQIMSI